MTKLTHQLIMGCYKNHCCAADIGLYVNIKARLNRRAVYVKWNGFWIFMGTMYIKMVIIVGDFQETNLILIRIVTFFILLIVLIKNVVIGNNLLMKREKFSTNICNYL